MRDNLDSIIGGVILFAFVFGGMAVISYLGG